MTKDEAYEIEKNKLVKASFRNSFSALRQAFGAGWKCATEEAKNQQAENNTKRRVRFRTTERFKAYL